MGGASQGQPTRGVIHGQDSTTAGRGRRHGRARPLGRGRRVRVRRERKRKRRGSGLCERQGNGQRDHRRRLPRARARARPRRRARPGRARPGRRRARTAAGIGATGTIRRRSRGRRARRGRRTTRARRLLDVLDLVVAPCGRGAPVRRPRPAPVLAAVAARWPRWRHARSPVTCAARANRRGEGKGSRMRSRGVRRILSAIRTLFVEPCRRARWGRPGRSLLPPSPRRFARARPRPGVAGRGRPGRRRRRVDVARGRR